MSNLSPTTLTTLTTVFALQLDAKAVAGVQLAEADQKMGWYGVHKDSTLGQAGYRFWAPRKDGVDFKGEKAALSCNTQKTAVKADKHVIQYVCNTVDTNTARFSQVKTKDFWNVCASASITAPPCQDDAEKYIAYALDSSGYYGCTKVPTYLLPLTFPLSTICNELPPPKPYHPTRKTQSKPTHFYDPLHLLPNSMNVLPVINCHDLLT